MSLARRSQRAILALIATLLTLSGCQVGSDAIPPTPVPVDTPATVPTPSPDKPARGGTVIVALPSEPDSLNYSLTSQETARQLISALETPMVRIRADGSLEPMLLDQVPSADNGRISDDLLTWQLTFRSNLTWSDGEPLDGRDFVFTWRTLSDSSYPAQLPGWSAIDDVRLSDDQLAVTVHLSQPYADFFNDVLTPRNPGGGFLLPAHLLQGLPAAAIPTSGYGGEKHIGSGPYKVVKWTPGEQLILDRNEHFRGEPPRLDRMVARFIPDDAERLRSLALGEVDLAIDLPEGTLLDSRQLPDVTLNVTPRPGTVEYLAFNLNDPDNLAAPHPLFADPAVRRAVVLAFNRWAAVEDTIGTESTVPGSLLEGSRWDDDSLEPYPYDPEQARALLDAAGWRIGTDGVRSRNGIRLTFSYSTTLGDEPIDAIRQRIQKAFIRDLALVGIEVKARNYPSAQLWADAANGGILATRQFDLADLPSSTRAGLTELVHRFDSRNIPTRFEPDGENVTGYRNTEVDRLLAQQQAEPDTQRRAVMVHDILRHIHTDVPVVPIYLHLAVHGSRDYVQGLEPGQLAGLWWNVEEWWVNRAAAG